MRIRRESSISSPWSGSTSFEEREFHSLDPTWGILHQSEHPLGSVDLHEKKDERMIETMRISLLLCFLLLPLESIMMSSSYAISTNEDEQMIHVGAGAFQDGFYDIAEKQFSLFLKNFPNHGKIYDVFYVLGKIYFHQERWKEARTVLLRIVQENRNFEAGDYTLFWMAQIDIKLGNFEASRRWLLTLLKNYPKFEWVDYAYYLLRLHRF